jgi:hypothetical protein
MVISNPRDKFNSYYSSDKAGSPEAVICLIDEMMAGDGQPRICYLGGGVVVATL